MRTPRLRRGSVLVMVLVLVVIGGLIAIGLLQSRLQPSLLVAQSVQRLDNDMTAQSAINQVTEVWSRLGTCSSDTGVACAGAGCACSCVVASAPVTIVVVPGPGTTCVLTAN